MRCLKRKTPPRPSLRPLTTMNLERKEIELNEAEKSIFGKILDATSDIDVEVRVAGGWVRDKLLGKESEDIDLALDTMMGEQFARHINAYLKVTSQTCATA